MRLSPKEHFDLSDAKSSGDNLLNRPPLVEVDTGEGITRGENGS
jgi:hypothetical protein